MLNFLFIIVSFVFYFDEMPVASGKIIIQEMKDGSYRIRCTKFTNTIQRNSSCLEGDGQGTVKARVSKVKTICGSDDADLVNEDAENLLASQEKLESVLLKHFLRKARNNKKKKGDKGNPNNQSTSWKGIGKHSQIDVCKELARRTSLQKGDDLRFSVERVNFFIRAESEVDTFLMDFVQIKQQHQIISLSSADVNRMGTLEEMIKSEEDMFWFKALGGQDVLREGILSHEDELDLLGRGNNNNNSNSAYESDSEYSASEDEDSYSILSGESDSAIGTGLSGPSSGSKKELGGLDSEISAFLKSISEHSLFSLKDSVNCPKLLFSHLQRWGKAIKKLYHEEAHQLINLPSPDCAESSTSLVQRNICSPPPSFVHSPFSGKVYCLNGEVEESEEENYLLQRKDFAAVKLAYNPFAYPVEPLVVKIYDLGKDPRRDTSLSSHRSRRISIFNRNSFWVERHILSKLGRLVDSFIVRRGKGRRAIGDKGYLVMPLVKGKQLSSFNWSTMSLDSIKWIKNECMKRLDEFHMITGYLHRDLHFDNILWSGNDTDSPIIIDFGLARPVRKASEMELEKRHLSFTFDRIITERSKILHNNNTGIYGSDQPVINPLSLKD